MQPRLSADFWVRAYLARLQAANLPAYVLRRGDPQAGAVLVKVADLAGNARLHARQFDMLADRYAWALRAEGAEADVDALLARESARDPDIWVIEVEARGGGDALLGQPGLEG
jgi:hypothetical protein